MTWVLLRGFLHTPEVGWKGIRPWAALGCPRPRPRIPQPRVEGRRVEGQEALRPAKLYVKVLVFKEMCKLSLRYAESCSSTYFHERVPRSTLSYWEVNHGSLVREVLTALLEALFLLGYGCTVLGPTKFTDRHKALQEAFLCVRVSLRKALPPVYADLTASEAEFTEGTPSGLGFASADGTFDARPVLNDLASRGTHHTPIVKPRKVSPGGYGARMRDRLFDESLYRFRSVGRGLSRALTVELGDRMEARRREAGETRTLLRLIVYCLKVLARWLYG